MKINTNHDCVLEGKDVKLGDWSKNIKPLYSSRKEYKKHLEKSTEVLSKQQQLLYASNDFALLIIFQAMEQELKHDFLWRTKCCLPECGRIGIFNRFYCEEVLIAKVHESILDAEKVPPSERAKEAIWKDRYKSIVDLESHLHRNGTRVIKFFLHLSKEEQRKRFLDRIDETNKNWKFSLADFVERKFWDKYMHAYQSCLTETSTTTAPWHIVPADDKDNARLIISQVIVEALEILKMRYPEVTKKRKKELKDLRISLS